MIEAGFKLVYKKEIQDSIMNVLKKSKESRIGSNSNNAQANPEAELKKYMNDAEACKLVEDGGSLKEYLVQR